MTNEAVIGICLLILAWRLLLIAFPNKKNIKIYESLHCSCIHEGAWYTISTHRTKEGAEKAIKERKKEIHEGASFLIEDDQYWRVNETELLY